VKNPISHPAKANHHVQCQHLTTHHRDTTVHISKTTIQHSYNRSPKRSQQSHTQLTALITPPLQYHIHLFNLEHTKDHKSEHESKDKSLVSINKKNSRQQKPKGWHHFTQLHFTQLHFTQLHFTQLNSNSNTIVAQPYGSSQQSTALTYRCQTSPTSQYSQHR